MQIRERRNHRQGFALRAFVVLAVVAGGATLLSGQQATTQRSGLDALLVPTTHPPLPSDLALYWFVPSGSAGSDRKSTRLNSSH